MLWMTKDGNCLNGCDITDEYLRNIVDFVFDGKGHAASYKAECLALLWLEAEFRGVTTGFINPESFIAYTSKRRAESVRAQKEFFNSD